MLYIFSLGILNVRPFLHAQNLNFTNEGTENHDLYIYIQFFVCIFLSANTCIYIIYLYMFI